MVWINNIVDYCSMIPRLAQDMLWQRKECATSRVSYKWEGCRFMLNTKINWLSTNIAMKVAIKDPNATVPSIGTVPKKRNKTKLWRSNHYRKEKVYFVKTQKHSMKRNTPRLVLKIKEAEKKLLQQNIWQSALK